MESTKNKQEALDCKIQVTQQFKSNIIMIRIENKKNSTSDLPYPINLQNPVKISMSG